MSPYLQIDDWAQNFFANSVRNDRMGTLAYFASCSLLSKIEYSAENVFGRSLLTPPRTLSSSPVPQKALVIPVINSDSFGASRNTCRRTRHHMVPARRLLEPPHRPLHHQVPLRRHQDPLSVLVITSDRSCALQNLLVVPCIDDKDISGTNRNTFTVPGIIH
jgi:hypothetical protein